MEILVFAWGAGGTATQGDKGQPDKAGVTWTTAPCNEGNNRQPVNASLTLATVPLRRGRPRATGQCQLDLGDGATAMGATTPAQRGGYQLGSFGPAQSAQLDWLWRGFQLSLARFCLLGSAGFRSA